MTELAEAQIAVELAEYATAKVSDLRRRLDAETEDRRRMTLLLADQRAATPPPAPEPPRTRWRRFMAWRRWP